MTVPKIHRPSKGSCKCGRPLTDEALCRGCMKPQEQCDCGEIIRPQKRPRFTPEQESDPRLLSTDYFDPPDE